MDVIIIILVNYLKEKQYLFLIVHAVSGFLAKSLSIYVDRFWTVSILYNFFLNLSILLFAG